MAEELEIDHKTALTHLKKAGYIEKLDTRVPHELTERILMNRVLICDSLLKRIERLNSLNPSQLPCATCVFTDLPVAFPLKTNDAKACARSADDNLARRHHKTGKRTRPCVESAERRREKAIKRIPRTPFGAASSSGRTRRDGRRRSLPLKDPTEC
ncbi:Histone-lysine N-methyltransferase SETMAR [Eumeta japonica]|uniref:Histone-lysine N-methyltransferase SETMAR n=1 Tax=Eumeta variegata TaxID=151549 RepID=A0A4C1WVJ3_EUMVA|nr:Histone-lysine N-methyltransferase SETMAR [Eumeta japonica]